jgi:CHAD domain-containing protein
MRSTRSIASTYCIGRQIVGLYRATLSAALACLHGDGPPDVHGARKEIKRARALLRLLRRSIGDAAYKRANRTLRDLAQTLARIRDAEALVSICERMLKRASQVEDEQALVALHIMLQRARRDLAAARTQTRKITRIRSPLLQCDVRAARWIVSEDWELVSASVRIAYRKARDAFRLARRSPTMEHLHDWRKQVKYVWQQVEALAPLALRRIAQEAKQLSNLSDWLGDERDLALLQSKVRVRTSGLTRPSAAGLSRLIDRRRKQLRRKAFRLGERVYADKPRRFQERYHKRWLRSLHGCINAPHRSVRTPLFAPRSGHDDRAIRGRRARNLRTAHWGYAAP